MGHVPKILVHYVRKILKLSRLFCSGSTKMSEKSPNTKMSENEYQNLRKLLLCLHTKISYKASVFPKSEIFIGISVSDLTRQYNFIFCNKLGYFLSSLCSEIFEQVSRYTELRQIALTDEHLQ